MKLATAAVLAVLALSGAAAAGGEPLLEAKVPIYNGATPLNVDYHSAPFVVDWDSDGKKDLLVGQEVYGYIRLFLNRGTDINPVFNGSVRIKASGVPITTTFG
jgi:hypothetical protein